MELRGERERSPKLALPRCHVGGNGIALAGLIAFDHPGGIQYAPPIR